jgi:hypothetical protein
MNASKKKDPRFWTKWRQADAVTTQNMTKRQQFEYNSAKTLLDFLRNRVDLSTISVVIEFIDEHLQKAGKSFESLGVSKAELQLAYADEAQFWLDYIRDNEDDDNSEQFAIWVEECLDKANEQNDNEETEVEQYPRRAS